MQDETALYGAKMMQPGMTAADSEDIYLIASSTEWMQSGLSHFMPCIIHSPDSFPIIHLYI